MTDKRGNKPKRLRVSTLTSEQKCVTEMCRLYKMARHGEITTNDLTKYVAAINSVHNALTIGRYGAEIEELKEAIEQRKAENARGNVVRLRRVQ
jgi:hypothetical protein